MRRRGFATFTAIVMLGVVGAAIAAGAAWSAAQWRRSQDARVDAQLRQLLIAGEVYASGAAGTHTVELPEAMLVAVERDGADATVSASWRGRRMTQTLRYEGGRLAEVRFEGVSRVSP